MNGFVLFSVLGLMSGVLSDNAASSSYVQETYSAPSLNSVPTRETYSAPAYDSPPPLTYSSGPSNPPTGSFYASDFSPAPNNNPGFGFGGNVGIGLPNAQNLISTGLSVVVGLFLASLVIQILTKIAASSIVQKIFDGIVGDDARYLDQGTIDSLTNFAVDAIHKLRERYEEN